MSEFVLWTPLFSFVIFILFFAIGDWISNLTDSKVSGLLIAMLLCCVAILIISTVVMLIVGGGTS